MESLDLGDLAEKVAFLLIQIPDEDWIKLAATEPQLTERFGMVLLVLNKRTFRVLNLLRYEP